MSYTRNNPGNTRWRRDPIRMHLRLTASAFLMKLVTALLLLSTTLPAQSGDTRAELKQLRSEISDLENKLKSAANTLKNELSKLNNFEQQLTLIGKTLRILHSEIRSNQQELHTITTRIDSLSGQIGRLQSLMRKQVVFTYRYQKGREMDWLLGAGNFNQALVRFRHLQSISDHGRRMYNRLKEKQRALHQLQAAREKELQKQQLLANEKTSEQKTQKQKNNDRKQLIQRVSRNKSLYEAAIRTKKESAERLQGLIATLQRDRERPAEPTRPQIDWKQIRGDFAAQRKKLNWPVKGKILHPFGNYRNPLLKTVLVNNGIDIQAKKGDQVHSVFSGVVSTITYISGFGNTLIVDHNNGFYTVYAHLDEIFVQKFQVIDPGTVVGTVGESGSLEGAKLHFEIYAANQPQNPMLWLK